MKHSSKRIFVLFLVIFQFVALFHTSGQTLPGKIHFTVSMENPARHIYHVTMQCRGLHKDSLDFSMPVWTPGYYRIMDYSQNVLSFHAAGEKGGNLTWTKIDKNTWRVMTESADSLTVEYDVYAYKISVADPFLDEDRGFLSPTGVFLYIEGMIRHPVTLTVRPYSGFKVLSTGLDPLKNVANTFFASDFDRLYDCPVLLGNHEIVTFTCRGIPHIIAMEDPGAIDRDKLSADLKRIVETTTSIFGEIPYTHYTFLMMKQGRGGLEHLNSMAVYYDPTRLTDEKAYTGYLSFIAHEYFHLYNVKTIRPFSLGPFDYDKENDTRLLWISEGITVYYENLILNRAGYMSREECLGEFSRAIRNYENIPGHLFQSATESGTDAWMQFFNFLDPEKNNTTISYYDKGCALGLLLDLAIRHDTKGKKSLDDVMRQLYFEFYKEKNRGFTEQEFRRTCETVAGCSLGEIFGYAASVAAIDYPKYFAYAGLDIDTIRHETAGAYTGIKTGTADDKITVSCVEWNSPGWKAGISSGDEIVEFNNRKVDPEGWKDAMSAIQPGDTIHITFSRRDKKKDAEIIAGKKQQSSFAIKPMTNPSPVQLEILNGWLTTP
jgi:predicted metalloprotease with PDZ domain